MGKRIVHMTKAQRHALRLELREAASKVRREELELMRERAALQQEIDIIDSQLAKVHRRQDDIRQSLDYLDDLDS